MNTQINNVLDFWFNQHSGTDWFQVNPDFDQKIKDQVRRMRRYQRKYKKYLRKKRIDKQMKYGAKIAEYLESKLPFPGIAEAVGGKDNLYVFSQMRGFRKGDESGDTPLISNSIGEFGDSSFSGPLQSIKNRMGMTDAEFFVNWLVGRL